MIPQPIRYRVAYFVGGAFLVNAAPHLVAGVWQPIPDAVFGAGFVIVASKCHVGRF